MLSTSRRLRAEQTRARLLALTPRWVPTQEVVEEELRRVEAGGDSPRPTQTEGADVAWVPERRRVPALLVLLAGGLVGSVAVWLLAVPRGEAAPAVTVTPPTTTLAPSGAAVPAGASASPVASPPDGGTGAVPAGQAGVVVVDVQGEVRHPGVVELPVGSRVVDALEAAGGVTRQAVTVSLNLAQVLADGTQVLVPDRRDPTVAPVTGAGSSTGTGSTPATGAGVPVDLNTATLEQLDALPGIGPVLAQRILDYRAQHGPFTSVDQLTDVSGIGDATLADLAPLVRV